MEYVYFNPNPKFNQTNDCVIRAICKLEDMDWVDVFMDLASLCVTRFQMPEVDTLWGEYLFRKGYKKHLIPNQCPNCYTVIDFCNDHPYGKYLLKTSGHVIAVINGDYYDSFNSGDDIPIYYLEKEC